MYRAVIASAILFTLVDAAANAKSAKPEGADLWNGSQIAWRSPAEGLAEAKRDGKVVLAIVVTDWCPVCRRYRNVFKDPKIVAASRDVAMILVDADHDADGDRAFAPEEQYVPRTVFVDANGRVIDALKRKGRENVHYVDSDSPGELLGLLKRAGAMRRPAAN